MLDNDRLQAAYQNVRSQLLAMRTPDGHWVGYLASSAVSTATAVSALSLAAAQSTSVAESSRWQALIAAGTQWLIAHQNHDGGWGDTDKSFSNIATTMLCRSALELSDVVASGAHCVARADRYISQHGSVNGVRARYGDDKTFAVPILTNAALAGIVPWRVVASLPFEFAWLPQSLYRFMRLPVVSYAIPALVAIGQAKFFHQRPRFLLLRWLRAWAAGPTLQVLKRMQPASGGYLEATPLTSFVVMSLASMGQVDHPVARRGIEFIIASARDDGSWPIDTNLATWNTTLSINALAAAGDNISELGCFDWLLRCQHRERHPFTGAEPGGWGWTDLSGAVPDADDTPGALLALAAWRGAPAIRSEDAARIRARAGEGLRWLLNLQNRDGGWPTFCRGWGRLPFDRSGNDLTAHALRAFKAWSQEIEAGQFCEHHVTARRVQRAVSRGVQYLSRKQDPSGYWNPLWFGNQHHPREDNPVYGTAKVLFAYRDLDRHEDPGFTKGLQWLLRAQDADSGGWGAGDIAANGCCSVEETALATELLLTTAQQMASDNSSKCHDAAVRGLGWLVNKVESQEGLEPSPIGFYFAKLWYYESLYPIIFALSALGSAVRMAKGGTRSSAASSQVETGVPQ